MRFKTLTPFLRILDIRAAGGRKDFVAPTIKSEVATLSA
jgi:hypothetical protein